MLWALQISRQRWLAKCLLSSPMPYQLMLAPLHYFQAKVYFSSTRVLSVSAASSTLSSARAYHTASPASSGCTGKLVADAQPPYKADVCSRQWPNAACFFIECFDFKRTVHSRRLYHRRSPRQFCSRAFSTSGHHLSRRRCLEDVTPSAYHAYTNSVRKTTAVAHVVDHVHTTTPNTHRPCCRIKCNGRRFFHSQRCH